MRRIAVLEVALWPHLEAEYWPGRRKRRFPTQRMQVRFGNLIPLSGDYQGERHVVVGKTLPARDGQEWVEFVEVAGPDPNPPPPDPRPPRRVDIVFIGPKKGQQPD